MPSHRWLNTGPEMMDIRVTGFDLNGIGMTSQRTRNRLVQRLKDAGIKSQAVLDVMAVTPRHLFVDEALAHRAYEDTALPIGHGQTISQPYTVARMTEALLAAGPLKDALLGVSLLQGIPFWVPGAREAWVYIKLADGRT